MPISETNALNDAVLADIRAMTGRVLNLPAEAISPDARLGHDLGLDSLGCIELALRMERAFGWEIPNEAVGGDRTVAEVARYIRRHRLELA